MAQYHKYQRRPGGCIKAVVNRRLATYELTPLGEAIISKYGIQDCGQVPSQLLSQLRKMGHAYGSSMAPAPTDPETRQLDFPF